MDLAALAAALPEHTLLGDPTREIRGLAYHSAAVQPGHLFAAIRGFAQDGHAFIPDALTRGAVALLVDHPVEARSAAQIVVPDTRAGLAHVAAAFYDHPSRAMTVIGVTGTNGKGVTTYFLDAILTRAGRRSALIGTMGARGPSGVIDTARTTPESLDLQRLLARLRDEGVTHVSMEVASHALALRRVEATRFGAAVFTNLTRDHLDFHGTFEAYLAAKRRLFEMVEPDGVSVLNADDPASEEMARASRAPVVRYAMSAAPVSASGAAVAPGAGAPPAPVDLRATDLRLNLDGTTFVAVTPQERVPVRLRIGGGFNVANALAALATGTALGVPLADAAAALETVIGVPGRFEPVWEGQDFAVIVDYAHTPDGLENVLRTARQIARGRVITVFGCGGDRDRTKRPMMGRLAVTLADLAVVTSDNPRTEDPRAIVEEILQGIRVMRTRNRYQVEVDRRAAIEKAIAAAAPGDVIVIAGKGHEPYQEIDGVRHPFDDRVVAREILRSRVGNQPPSGGTAGPPVGRGMLTLADVAEATGARVHPPMKVGQLAGRRIQGVSTDTRTLRSGDLFVALRGPRTDGHQFIGAAASKGAVGAVASALANDLDLGAMPVFLVPDTLRALGAIAARYRRGLAADVIGVTGSVGKTSVVLLTASVLAQRFRVIQSEENWNAEIGVPLTLLRAQAGTRQVIVAEMAMRGPGQIHELVDLARPRIGVVTNVGEAHLGLLGNVAEIAAAKGELIEGLPPDGVAVLNADDPWTERLAAQARCRVIRFGLGAEAEVRAEAIRPGERAVTFRVRVGEDAADVLLPLVGAHHVANALAAAAVGVALGLPAAVIAAGLERAAHPSRRLQIEEAGSLLILDDSYNASPRSARAAFDALAQAAGPRRRVAVLGDMKELGDRSADLHREIGREAARSGVAVVVAVGPEAEALAEGAREVLAAASVIHVAHREAAIPMLREVVRSGDAVLVKGSRAMGLEAVVESLRATAVAS
ncbi:MAG TPA: UDP-N-acetylmuramoyl-L-alanyl-D-glutamate--2,6-diaminopimelate ligase [bacterium]|nr:UDP-N-acetylmuramoyl-L-alanyl-D-glutamate--2,6-diaminopimelate ligase [bacterium]